jgi:hypothetical protein
MLERHEQESRRADGGGEIVLADDKPRMIEILPAGIGGYIRASTVANYR